MTYGGSDGLGCARLLEAQLEAVLPRMVSGDGDGGGRRSSTFLHRCLRRKLEQILIKIFSQKL